MLSIDDCIALCGLDRKKVQAIAEHEHIPEVAAAALASYLLHHDGGEDEIRRLIVEDLNSALAEGDKDRARELLMALREFIAERSLH